MFCIPRGLTGTLTSTLIFADRGKGRGKAVVEELNDKTMMSQVSLSEAGAMPECHELPEVFVDK